MDINNIPKNKGIQKDYEKKDYKKQDYSPPKPQRNILKGIERGIV